MKSPPGRDLPADGPADRAVHRPDPEPLHTDDVRAVAIGTAMWAVALVVALVAHDRLSDDGHGSWPWIALAGVFLGLVGLRHVRRRQRRSRDTA